MIVEVPATDDATQAVPLTPAALGFSASEWWPHQRETVGAILQAFGDGRRVVILSAPTGSGKTIIAAAVAKLLETRSLTMVHTLALQDQYRRTASWAEIGKGKSNYPCGFPDTPRRAFVRQRLGRTPPFNAEDCDEYVGCDNADPDGCDYFRALGRAAQADHVIFNYAFATRITLPAMLRRGIFRGGADIGSTDDSDKEGAAAVLNPFRGDQRPLAILDEGHLANNAIVSAFTLDFWHSTLQGVGLQVPTGDDLLEWRRWADGAIRQLRGIESSDDPIQARRVDNLRSRLRTLAMINTADWVVTREARVSHVQPIWARCIYHTAPFLRTYPMILIMSATPGDPSLLAHKLGFEEGECALVTMPSNFPVENRPVFYWPVVRLSSKSDEADYATLASAIEFIATQPRLAATKGIVHTPSYKLVKQLRECLGSLNGRVLYQESSAVREKMVEAFAGTDHPWLLVSPSLATGFDLPYEISYQVIAKTPFADLSDPVVRARREYTLPDDSRFGKRCYDDDTASAVVQACGRAVRAPDDMGVSYILDENFIGLYKRAYFPAYFKDAFHWL